MFDVLKKLFTNSESPAKEEMTLAMAAGALLLEVSKADYQQDPEEVEKVRALLKQHFDVGLDEMEAFMVKAGKACDDSTALYPFTRYINDNCSNVEKYQLVHSLWEVAAEDGVISKYEEHVIRKIADLIYLPHREFIRAKLSVTEQLPGK